MTSAALEVPASCLKDYARPRIADWRNRGDGPPTNGGRTISRKRQVGGGLAFFPERRMCPRWLEGALCTTVAPKRTPDTGCRKRRMMGTLHGEGCNPAHLV